MKFRIPFSKSSGNRDLPDTSHQISISSTPTIQRGDVVNGLEFTIQTIEGVIDLVPIDMAKSVLMGITTVLSLLQKSLKNEDGLKSLSQKCSVICSTLAQAIKGVSMDKMSPVLKEALSDLKGSIDGLLLRVKHALDHRSVRKFLTASLRAKQINEWSDDLSMTFQLFSTRLNIVGGIRLEQLCDYMKRTEVPNRIPEPPPPSPVMFVGRDALLSEVKGALLQDKDVVLMGPGGIGKSCMAKALINDEDIKKRCGRRFFVTFDGMDPKTITLGSFIDRIASVLGLSLFGTESRRQVISNLGSSPVLMVLDNAETFEDAADEGAATEIASFVSEIATTQGVTVVLTSRTTNNARNVRWTRVVVPPLESEPARCYFKDICSCKISDDDIDTLLGAVDFHPLSIHILAYTAEENRWTGKTLLDRWNEQQSRLLQTGGRKENLGFTIALSLDSPSIKALGTHALHVLWIVAFFPQGINESHIRRLFPSIRDISGLFDTLYKLSLVYRSGSFLTTLAPVRLYLLDAYPSAGLELLVDIQDMYYQSLKEVSEDKDWRAELVISDHLNIEHLIEFDLTRSPDDALVIFACQTFLCGLEDHRLRPTSLGPLISSISETSSDLQQVKAHCLKALGDLYFELSDCSLAESYYLAARTLYIAIQDHWGIASCTMYAAGTYISRGHFPRAQQLLQKIIDSLTWQQMSELYKARVHFDLDVCRMYTSSEGVDKLFPSSADDNEFGLQSRVRQWTARLCHGYNTPEEVERHLEPIRSLRMSSSYVGDRLKFLSVMANASFLKGNYDRAMEILDEAQASVEGDLQSTLSVLKSKAGVAATQGKYVLARSLLQDCIDTLGVVATPSCINFLEMLYVQGRNELFAGDYSKARQIFSDVIKDCEVQDAIELKAFCMRALGELEKLLDHKAGSDRYFTQAVELCKEAGIPPKLLGVGTLDHHKYPGWKDFLRVHTATD